MTKFKWNGRFLNEKFDRQKLETNILPKTSTMRDWCQGFYFSFISSSNNSTKGQLDVAMLSLKLHQFGHAFSDEPSMFSNTRLNPYILGKDCFMLILRP